jgi:hypothetical protein
MGKFRWIIDPLNFPIAGFFPVIRPCVRSTGHSGTTTLTASRPCGPGPGPTPRAKDTLAPQASRLRNRIAPTTSRIAVYTANTVNWPQGENRCGSWGLIVADMAEPAESGSHRTMS